MERGKLFQTPLAARQRLAYLREILNWMYAEGRSPRQLQTDFWEWFTGATHEQATGEWHANFEKIYAATAGRDWPRIQRDLREAFSAQVANADKPKPTLAPKLAWRIGTWTASDKSSYFQYSPVLDLDLKEEYLVVLALNAALSDLSGLAVDVVGQCEVCERWFIRTRGARRRYCSTRCTWRAFKAREKPRSKARSSRPAKRGPR